MLSLRELMHHPHVLQKEVVQTLEHPTAGTIRQLAPMLRLSQTPAEIAGPRRDWESTPRRCLRWPGTTRRRSTS
ncbi:hypothetical protein KAE78_06110 [Microbacterium sp. NIBRBAC000506063]|nr:hypothetical protein KAE78_06110 [Microbacterium sp. NIBRBAC000506063]